MVKTVQKMTMPLLKRLSHDSRFRHMPQQASIHINAWYGEHSKKAISTAFLKEKGLSEQEIIERSYMLVCDSR
ncbi:hypothetical protein O9993_11115 [Vibrio lentus]|nr:hypothetical protein [Vibrio lentus]